MEFIKTDFEDCYIIKIEKKKDDRGFFARSWDSKIFEEYKLEKNIVQCNISFNLKKNTIRGMHYQSSPYEEAKLVRCTKGKIIDVIIDLRPNSITFKKWLSVELSEDNFCTLYIPKGMAHGFQTLVDNTEVFYQMTEKYMPEFAKGIRWNDTTFNINWPNKSPIISNKDNEYDDFIDRGEIKNE
jgi:dTDP-4-dehydrorhamnose 3,5-epimerase